MKKTATILILSALTLAANAGESAVYRTAPQSRLEASNPGFGTVVFAGGDVREDAWYSHVGFIHSLNCDLNESGVFLRGFAGWGGYNYTQEALASSNVEGDLFDADLGLGYNFVLNEDWKLGAFAAGHYHSEDINQTDPSNDPEGDNVGAKFGIDLTGTTGAIWWNGIAQYSTVQDAVWTRARVGYNFGGVVIGPEFTYLENHSFEEKRIGAFAKVQVLDNIEISGSVGAANYEGDRSNDDDSWYGTLGVSYAF